LVPLPSNYFDYEGDGISPGFNVGVLWQPNPKWSFGVTYRSAVELDYSGHSEVSIVPGEVDSDTRIDFPRMIAWGISFRPTPRWNLEIDVDWTDWDTLDTVTLHDTQFGDVSLPLHWRSSFFYEAGVTHYFPSGYFLSAGYFFSESSTPDEYFNPVVPDTDLHVGSIGAGYTGQHWRWTIAGQIIAGPWRTVSGSQPSLAGQSADGDYQLFIPAITFSVGYRF
jgi:long-chain fatty acid transport protein